MTVRATFAILTLSFILSAPAGWGASPEPSQGPPVFHLGVVPYYPPDKMFQLWRPVIDYLDRTTPYRWELKLGETHDQLVEGMCNGQVDVAFLGPIPLGKALRKCGVKPFLLALGVDGSPVYHSVLVTTDPRVRSVADLEGRTVALFEKSTASWYLPLSMMAERGLRRGEFQELHLPNQDRVMAAVLSNQAAAGGVKDSLFKRFADGKLRVLATSGPLPQFAFCASSSLPPAAEKAFASALLALDPTRRPADRKTVEGWDPELSSGVVAAPPDLVKQVEDLLRSVEPFLK